MTKELYNKLMAFGNDCEPFLTHNYMRTTDLDDGTATVTLPMHTESLNRWGGAHGGILFSLCDVAMGMAGKLAFCSAEMTDETGKVIVRAHCVMCFTGKALPL